MVVKFLKDMSDAIYLTAIVQEAGRFFYQNFSKYTREQQERFEAQRRRLSQQVKYTNRTVLQVNQDRALLERRCKDKEGILEKKVSELNRQLDEASQRYSYHYELSNRRIPKDITKRLGQILGRYNRQNVPVVITDPIGKTVIYSNIPTKELVGRNFSSYLLEHRFPPASDERSYQEIRTIHIGSHIYNIDQERRVIEINGEQYAIRIRLTKLGTREGLLRVAHEAAQWLYRTKAKPQET